MRTTVLLAGLLLAAGAAAAGSLDEPELTDAAGDCAFVVGNEYLDIVAAWIGAEDEASFEVGLAIEKWNEVPGRASGFTVQFQHQGVQFGVAAAYVDQWYFGNALYDGTFVRNYSDASGSFEPGSPSIITVTFLKSNFPHGDTADDSLVNFYALSGDLKTAAPWVLAPVEVPGDPTVVECDEGTSDAVYRFQVGAHSAHAPSSESGGASPAADAPVAPAEAGDETVAPAGAPPESEETPLGPLVALAAAALAAFAARRRAP